MNFLIFRREKLETQMIEMEERRISRIMGTAKPKLFEQKDGANFGPFKVKSHKKSSLGELLAKEGSSGLRRSSDGHQVEF